jgi:outer membrane protein
MNMFNSHARHLLLAISMGLMVSGVWAQNIKIGFVNTDRIFSESSAAKAAQTKLEQEFTRREREVETLGNQLRAAAERFDREAPTLSDSQRNTRQRQIVDLDREFQRKRQAFQEDLNLRKNEELQLVLERANRVIRQIAEAENYDLILQEAVYIHAKHDITEKVIRGLDSAR